MLAVVPGVVSINTTAQRQRPWFICISRIPRLQHRPLLIPQQVSLKTTRHNKAYLSPMKRLYLCVSQIHSLESVPSNPRGVSQIHLMHLVSDLADRCVNSQAVQQPDESQWPVQRCGSEKKRPRVTHCRALVSEAWTSNAQC